jgi:miniconductance mechanosensitive channel
VPGYNADGDVIDISLHTIKIQNFDKTITMIPTAKLIEGSFINWRGMQETGGRRIKRAVYIDISSVKFCDEAMLAKYENISLLNKYLNDKKKELAEYNKEHGTKDTSLVNGRRLTNIGTFRAYLNAYLKNRSDIDKKFTFLIRQLPSTSQGVPMEIYVFTNTTVWKDYEGIQSDVFDHILAAVPEFELKIFQEPAGSDIQFAAQSLTENKPSDQLLAEVNKDADNPNIEVKNPDERNGKQ